MSLNVPYSRHCEVSCSYVKSCVSPRLSVTTITDLLLLNEIYRFYLPGHDPPHFINLGH